jgi:hypothetical protein
LLPRKDIKPQLLPILISLLAKRLPLSHVVPRLPLMVETAILDLVEVSTSVAVVTSSKADQDPKAVVTLAKPADVEVHLEVVAQAKRQTLDLF